MVWISKSYVSYVTSDLAECQSGSHVVANRHKFSRRGGSGLECRPQPNLPFTVRLRTNHWILVWIAANAALLGSLSVVFRIETKIRQIRYELKCHVNFISPTADFFRLPPPQTFFHAYLSPNFPEPKTEPGLAP